MKILKNRLYLLNLLAIVMVFALPVKAQVTIGSQKAPHKFSVLELISNDRGLRLPQLTTEERDNLKLDELTDPDTIQAAKGLVIFNTDTECVEFWNGVGWVSICTTVKPILNVIPIELAFDDTGEPAQNVTVITNIPNGWTIMSQPDWITAIPASGMNNASFSVTADVNNSPDARSGYIVVTAGALKDTVTVTQFEAVPLTGTGTEDDPYLVCSPEQLDAVRDDPSAYYKLCRDIDLTSYLASGGEGYTKWGAEGWMPLGNSAVPFIGGMDGDGHTIFGLRINRVGTNEIGLFGVVDNGTIKNLALQLTNNINNSTGTYVGGLAGRASGSSCVISNCRVTGTGSISGGSYIGGLIGQINRSATISGCNSSVTISGSNSVGGLVGWVGESGRGNGNITNCYATGSVTGGGSNIGGLVGQLYNGNLTDCYVTGEVSGTGTGSTDVVGGIAGRMTTAGCRVTNCVALNPKVSAAYGTDVGRVVGKRENGTNTNNWALGGMEVYIGGGALKSPLDNTGSGIDGADAGDADSKTADWWQAASPDGPGWDNTIWNFIDGQLPTLK